MDIAQNGLLTVWEIAKTIYDLSVMGRRNCVGGVARGGHPAAWRLIKMNGSAVELSRSCATRDRINTHMHTHAFNGIYVRGDDVTHSSSPWQSRDIRMAGRFRRWRLGFATVRELK